MTDYRQATSIYSKWISQVACCVDQRFYLRSANHIQLLAYACRWRQAAFRKCNKPCLKDDGSLITYKKHEYCEECFEEEAYPISLFSNKKMSVSIVGYDDEEGLFAVQIKNKTKYELYTYQDGDKALMDGKDSCIGETSGSQALHTQQCPLKRLLPYFAPSERASTSGTPFTSPPKATHSS